MKRLGLVSILFSLLLLTGCDEGEVTPGLEGWNPGLCTGKSANSCGVDWFISFAAESFPENAQILLNDRIIIDECDPHRPDHPNWSLTTTTQIVEFKISDYANLDGTQKLNLRVFDRGNCYGAKTEHSYEAKQKYYIENANGQKRILVKKT